MACGDTGFLDRFGPRGGVTPYSCMSVISGSRRRTVLQRAEGSYVLASWSLDRLAIGAVLFLFSFLPLSISSSIFFSFLPVPLLGVPLPFLL